MSLHITILSTSMLVCASISVLSPTMARAQSDYPNRPISVVVPYPAGGGTDAVARSVMQQVAKELAAVVVVENRVGASGTIAVAHVAKAAPDGYTIGWFTGGPIVLAPITEPSLPYDVERDLVPVSQVQITDHVLAARPGLPANSVAELIQLAKASPNGISMGHAGVGTAQYLAVLMLEKVGGVELNDIPYKGDPPLLADMMGGRIDVGVITVTSAIPLVKAGRIKLLASAGANRATLFPQTPSMTEAGYPDIEANSHMGIFVPRGTPQHIIDRLHDAIVAALRIPELRNKMASMGGTPVGSSPEAFAAFLKVDSARARRMLQDTNVKER